MKKGLDVYDEVRITSAKILSQNTCSKQFYYKYDYTGTQKLPVKGASFYTLRGAAIHKAIFDLVEQLDHKLVKNFLKLSQQVFVQKCSQIFDELLEKELIAYDIEEVQGVPTAMKITMFNKKDRTSTTIETLSVKYNMDLPDNLFSERNLRV